MTKKANAPWANTSLTPFASTFPESCKGENCTYPEGEHSPECLAEYEKVTQTFVSKPDVTHLMNDGVNIHPSNVATINPFAKVEAPVEKVAEPNIAPDGTPLWGDFVKFIQKHAVVISQVRYPTPRGECVDTIRKGIRVYDHPTCMIRHIAGEWASWEDAQALEAQ